MPKLSVIDNCSLGLRAILAAKYAGVEIEKATLNPKDHPMGKCPLLEDGDVTIFTANAAAKYLARGTDLVGKTETDKIFVDQWMEFCEEIDGPASVWVLPLICDFAVCPNALKKAKGEMRKAMTVLNKHLLNCTYLVGERVTLADICVFASLLEPYRRVLDVGFRKGFNNLTRWFNMMAHQPNVAAIVGDVVLCTKAQEPKKEEAKEQPKKAEKPKEQPKKAEKKPAADDEEEEEKEKPKEKPKNPLDLLPPGKFTMDEWKRVYSNEDTVKVAIPWFWEHYDTEGYSYWFAKYKYEHNEPQMFMVANSLTGWIQRLDPLRKYGFGSLCIFGMNRPYEVETFWMFRGKEIPKEMLDCDDSELYDWVRADEKDKAKIDAFLAWEGDFGGRTFNQGKIFK
jgi:elongation factor 1-gamma